MKPCFTKPWVPESPQEPQSPFPPQRQWAQITLDGGQWWNLRTPKVQGLVL